jgi:hypothetical protein
MLKHVGKMKNNGAKIVVAYRTVPGDSSSALVVGTGNLGETYHDSLMSLVQAADAQQTNELAEVLAVRKFPDGSNMLQWLHTHGHLKKVPTAGVIMTPTPQASVALDELNKIIAEQKGVSVDDLAISDGSKPAAAKTTKTTSSEVVEGKSLSTPEEMRSRADALFKEAQELRSRADELDPPKKKSKKVTVAAE